MLGSLFGGSSEPKAEAANDTADGAATWSSDPHQRVVQLTTQLKVARGQLDKKSDLCDELAAQLRSLEDDLAEREELAQEARALFNAAGAELRAAAHAHVVDREELSEAVSAAHSKADALQNEAKDLRTRTEQEAICVERLESCESHARLGEAEADALAAARAGEIARIRRALSEEEAQAAGAAERASEGYDRLAARLHEAQRQMDTEETLARSRVAEEARCALEVASKTSELGRVSAALRAMQEECREVEARMRSQEEDARIQGEVSESALLQTGEEAASALAKCREELLAAVGEHEAEAASCRNELGRLAAEVAAQADAHREAEARAEAAGEELLRRQDAAVEANVRSEAEHAELLHSIDDLKAKATRAVEECVESDANGQRMCNELREQFAEAATGHSRDRAEAEKLLEDTTAEHVVALRRMSTELLTSRSEFDSELQSAHEAVEAGARDREFALESLGGEAAERERIAAAQHQEQVSRLLARAENAEEKLAAKMKEAEALSVQLQTERAARESAESTCAILRDAAERSAAQAAADYRSLESCFDAHRSGASAATSDAAARHSKLVDELQDLRSKLAEAVEREAELKVAIRNERELHEGALQMLRQKEDTDNEQTKDLKREIVDLSAEVEQKEEDMLNTQFEMVTLQNSLQDQVRQLAETSAALQEGRDLVAEKDERLRTALRRQDELVGQMNEATSRLQEKVGQLSKELEGSRCSYQSLEEQTRAVIERLENDRASLSEQLAHAQTEVAGLVAQQEKAQASVAEHARRWEERVESARVDVTQLRSEAAAAEQLHLASEGQLKALHERIATMQACAELHSEELRHAEREAAEHAAVAGQREVCAQEAAQSAELGRAELQDLAEQLQRASSASEAHVAELGAAVAEVRSRDEETACLVGELAAERSENLATTAAHASTREALSEQEAASAEFARARDVTSAEIEALYVELQERERAATLHREKIEQDLQGAWRAEEGQQRLEQQVVEEREAAVGEAVSAKEAADERGENLLAELAARASEHGILSESVEEHVHELGQQRLQFEKLELAWRSHSSENEGSVLRLTQELQATEAEGAQLKEQLRVELGAATERASSQQEAMARSFAEELDAANTAMGSLRATMSERAVAFEQLQTEAGAWQLEAETSARHGADFKELVSEREARTHQQIAELQALVDQKVDEVGRLQGAVWATEDELKRARAETKATLERRATESEARFKQLEDEAAALRQRESDLAERLKAEVRGARELQERLLAAAERRTAAEARAKDSAAALERSRLLERQALERAQELRIQLELLREFGHEDFMQPARGPEVFAPPARAAEAIDAPKDEGKAKAKNAVDEKLGAALPSVLIAVTLNLGLSRTATLSVAPWQSRSDFEGVVQAFLEEHRIKALFKDALVRFLEDVDATVESYPANVEADLAELYTRFG